MQSVAEGVEMLVGQHRCGYEHGNLFAVDCGFESCSYSYFCFAEPHISAYQSIHWTFTFHICLNGLGGGELASFLSGFVRNYFENSYKEMVSFFAKDQKISANDLKDIIDMIEKGKE